MYPVYEEGDGATYAALEYAESDVKFFAQFGIESQVIADGRFWRVRIA